MAKSKIRVTIDSALASLWVWPGKKKAFFYEILDSNGSSFAGIMYQVSGQNSLPYEVNMAGCVSFRIKVQILTFYMDVCMGNKGSSTGAAAYQLGNTSSRTITEVKQR